MARFSLKSVLTLAMGSALTLPAVFAAGEISGALNSLIGTLSDFFGNVVPQLDNIGIYRLIYWIVVFAVSRYLFKFTVFKASGGDDQKKAMSNLAITLAAVVASIGAIMTPTDILTFIFSLYAGLLSLIVILFILGVLIYNVYQKDFLTDMPALNQFTKAALLAICVFILTYLTDLYGTLMPYLATVAPFIMLLMTAMLVWATIKGITGLFSGKKGAPTESGKTEITIPPEIKKTEEDEAAKLAKQLKEHEESVAAFDKRKELERQEAEKLAAGAKTGTDVDVDPRLVTIEELAAKQDIDDFNKSAKTIENYNKIIGVITERITIQGQAFTQTNNRAGLDLLVKVKQKVVSMHDDLKSIVQLQSEQQTALQSKAKLFAKAKTYLTKDGKKVMAKNAALAASNHVEIVKQEAIIQELVGEKLKVERRMSQSLETIRVGLMEGAKIAGTPNADQPIIRNAK